MIEELFPGLCLARAILAFLVESWISRWKERPLYGTGLMEVPWGQERLHSLSGSSTSPRCSASLSPHPTWIFLVPQNCFTLDQRNFENVWFFKSWGPVGKAVCHLVMLKKRGKESVIVNKVWGTKKQRAIKNSHSNFCLDFFLKILSNLSHLWNSHVH